MVCSFDLINCSAKTERALFAFVARKATTALVVSAFGFFVYITSRLCLIDLDKRWTWKGSRVSSSGLGILARHHKAGRAEQRRKRLIATDHSLHADSLWTFRYATLG